MSKLRVCTLNCNARLTNDDFVLDLTFFLKQESIDILLVQETGLQNNTPDLSAELRDDYFPILNCGANRNSSTAIFIRTRLVPYISEQQNLPNGRAQFLQLEIPNNSTISIFNVYYPCNLEYTSNSAPAHTIASSLTEFLLTDYNNHSSKGPTFIGGDFNETRFSFERSSGKQGPHGCRFIHKIMTTANFIDLSEDYPDYTFGGFVYGNYTRSKLDRFLGSQNSESHISNYTVYQNNSGQLGSDHLPISMEITLTLNRKSSPPKRTFPVLRPSMFSWDHKQSLWDSTNKEMRIFWNELKNMSDETFTNPVLIDKLMKTFVEIIHNQARKIPRFYKKSNSRLNKNVLLKSLIQRRRTLRKTKRILSTFLQTSVKSTPEEISKFCVCGSKIFPSVHWTSSRLAQVEFELRKEIKNLTRRILAVLSQEKCLSAQTNEVHFSESRKSFYEKYIRGAERKAGLIQRIKDPETDDLVTDSTQVREVIEREAKKIFQNNPKPPPRPKWFKQLYNPKSKSCRQEDWNGLVSPFILSEIVTALNSAKGKAPGMDGLTKEFILLLCKPNPQISNPFTPEYSSYTGRVLLLLLNKWLATGICPESCAIGQILPIKKPGKDGDFYSNRRPLTMLSELVKLPMKILATRLQQVLYQNPDFLEPAQNAFLKEGGIDGPLRFLIDQFQLNNQNCKSLFVLSYDQAKAYDSVQFWHIEASLRRFSFPPQFINFIMNYLNSSSSCILTSHGNTDKFSLKCSVRQGDPLSPLLYIICLDSLHTLLRLKSEENNWGLLWGNDLETFRSVSLGYADDTAVFATSPSDIHKIHELVTEFFQAHSLRLNCKKTKARYSNCKPDEISNLLAFDWGLDANEIQWQDETKAFRYLGVMLSLDLNPQHHISYCEQKRLYPYLRRLKTSRLSLKQSLYATREMIWSILDFSTRFLPLPTDFITKWDSYFTNALIQRANLCRSSITHDGFWCAVNLLRYKYHYPVANVAELVTHINLPRSLYSLCSRMKLFTPRSMGIRDPLHYRRMSPNDTLSNLQFFFDKYQIDVRRNQMYKGNIHHVQIIGVSPFPDSQPLLPRPNNFLKSPNFGQSFPTSNSCQTLWVDGGFYRNSYQWSIVHLSASHKFEFKRGNLMFPESIGIGEAFGAEALALGYALSEFPDMRLNIYSDCERLLSLINNTNDLTARKWIRKEGRPLLQHIHQKLHPNVHNFLHIRRNTGDHRIVGEGNKTADMHVKLARKVQPERLTLHSAEYPVLLFLGDNMVCGDYRLHLTHHMWKYQMHAWMCTPSQGLLPRLQYSKCKELISSLSLLIKDDQYLPWYIDTICLNLPNRHILQFNYNREFCWLCAMPFIDDSRHYLHCPFLQSDLHQMYTLKPILFSKSHPLTQKLHQNLETFLYSAKSYLQRHHSTFSRNLHHSFIYRYCTYACLQKSGIEIHNFILVMRHVQICENITHPATLPLTAEETQILCRRYPYTVAVVPNTSHIPAEAPFWSLYGFSEVDIPSLNKLSWYQDHTFHNFLFLHRFPAICNEFWSLTGQIQNLCQNGAYCWIFTDFPIPSKYKGPKDVLTTCSHDSILNFWTWEFAPNISDLPNLRFKIPKINYKVPSIDNWARIPPNTPLFKCKRWLLQIEIETLSEEEDEVLNDWKKLNCIAFCLGFASDKQLSFFQRNQFNRPFSQRMQKQCWKSFKQIYKKRRSRYNIVKKWILSTNTPLQL